MNIEAQGDTIIVDEVKDVGLVSNLIHIPNEFANKTDACRGVVLSVGPDYKHDVKVGDIVIYRRNECIDIKDNGRTYKSIKGKMVDAIEE